MEKVRKIDFTYLILNYFFLLFHLGGSTELLTSLVNVGHRVDEE